MKRRRRAKTAGQQPAGRTSPDPAARDALLTGVRKRRLELTALAAEVARQRARRLAQQDAVSGTISPGASADLRQRVTEMYDLVPVPYLMLSDLGIILKVNERALDLLGGDRTWVIGRPLVAYVGKKDLRSILTGLYGCRIGQSATVEVELRTAQGSRHVQLIARCEDGGHGAIFHVALVDLTALRQLEAQRRVAEHQRQQSEEAEQVARAASEAKDEFLAMLSHELRTPLTPILAAIDSLVAHDSLPPDVKSKIDVIRRNVKAEARLIDDLLDVARIIRTKFEITRQPIDLHRVITEVLDGWAPPLADRHLTLQVRLEAGAHWVDGDAGRLGQVFLNLIGNAIKFSDAGGRISVRTEEHDGQVRVTVADTGVGMTAGQMESVFTPFLRGEGVSPRRGLGLGLVISHAIVDAHEGTLQVWSGGPGSGTTVRVELPTVPAPATTEVPAAVESTAPATGTKVLLVEDDPDSGEMLAILLSSAGFDVRIAGCFHDAQALAGWCEVMVSDIALPDGSGLDLVRDIRTRRPVRAIALSGFGSREDVQKSLEAGFEAHLTKPVDLDRLVAAVRRLTSDDAPRT